MKKLIIIISPLLLIAILYAMSGDEVNPNYLEQVSEEIESRKRYLEHSDESPFNQFNQPYASPSYFEVDPSYKVNARVERFEKREIMLLGTSSGKTERYLKYAWLHFNVQETDQKLLVLKSVGFGSSQTLFCAFSDDTSGEQTYGGGRYLDVEIGKSNKTTIDFNLAYNPYCAYVDEYSCPLPPGENVLNVSIFAGEKSYKSKD